MKLRKLAIALAVTTSFSSFYMVESKKALGTTDPNTVANVYFDSTDPGNNYNQNWGTHYATAYYGSSMRYSNTVNNYVEKQFVGDNIHWISLKNNDLGIAEVFIDGVSRGNVDLYSPYSIAQADVFSVSNLSQGTHTIKVVVTGKKNIASLNSNVVHDGFFVKPDNVVTMPENSTSFEGLAKINFTFRYLSELDTPYETDKPIIDFSNGIRQLQELISSYAGNTTVVVYNGNQTTVANILDELKVKLKAGLINYYKQSYGNIISSVRANALYYENKTLTDSDDLTGVLSNFKNFDMVFSMYAGVNSFKTPDIVQIMSNVKGKMSAQYIANFIEVKTNNLFVENNIDNVINRYKQLTALSSSVKEESILINGNTMTINEYMQKQKQT